MLLELDLTKETEDDANNKKHVQQNNRTDSMCNASTEEHSEQPIPNIKELLVTFVDANISHINATKALSVGWFSSINLSRNRSFVGNINLNNRL